MRIRSYPWKTLLDHCNRILPLYVTVSFSFVFFCIFLYLFFFYPINIQINLLPAFGEFQCDLILFSNAFIQLFIVMILNYNLNIRKIKETNI